MLPHRIHFYKKDEPSEKSSIENLIDCAVKDKEIRDIGFDETSFSDEINQTLSSLNMRNYTIFGLGRSLVIPLPEDEIFKVFYNYETHNPDGKQELSFKSYTIWTYRDSNFTDFLILPPNVKETRKLVDIIRQDEDGIINDEGKVLLEIAERYGKSNGSHPLTTMDPQHYNQFRQLSQGFSDITNNIREVQKYFAHLASLYLLGEFADLSGSKVLVGVKGLVPERNALIVGFALPLPQYTSDKVKESEVIGSIKELKSVLVSDSSWFHFGELQRPLNMNKIIGSFGELGSAFRRGTEGEQPSCMYAAIATEYLVSELYNAISGKQCDRESFEKKLKFLNETEQFNGLLEPYINLIKNQPLKTPLNVRGDGAHVTKPDMFNSEEQYLNNWATLFYQDLVKTLVTGMAGNPQQYFDFDKYGRDVGLVKNKEEGAAFVPISVAKHYDKIPKQN
ncbi:MAG: hypothetical protein QGH19_01295 [Candidatus Woesearchaeota archaeon]|nr:hypothetical protein [Candidatus Woesearchaeota archaeon]